MEESQPQSAPRRPYRNWPFRVFVGLVLLIPLGFVSLVVVDRLTWRWFTEREAIAALSGARSPQELEAAAGSLGIFISRPDGSWIAIHYMDTHAGRIESLAIARDNGGAWFECDHHFCGQFAGYKAIHRMDKAMRDAGLEPDERTPTATDAALDAMAAAPSLDAARQELIGLGFVRLKR